MKKVFTLILIISSLNLFAQNQPKGFHLDKPVNMAAILAKKPGITLGFSSVSEARTIINEIMDAVEMQQNFEVRSTTQVDNAAAVVYAGQRYILYNPNFINQLDNAANDKWASISVIGHEIGHHLLGHTMDGRGSQIPKELAADEFSGLVLHRMGSSLQQAQLAMRLISTPNASATHPAGPDRLEAIAKGWNSTTAQNNRDNNDVVINTPQDNGRNRYPNQNPQTYPPAGRSYPQRRGGRNTYPNDGRTYPQTSDGRNYPGTGRTYPDGDNRSNYPGNTDPRRSGGNGYPGSSNRGGSTTYENIVYDISFTGARGQQYFITDQNNVVVMRGNQAVLVAKVTRTNRRDYPFVIYDDQQQIYIDTRGNLLTETGRNVGYITRHL
jgi:hypothetical protein